MRTITRTVTVFRFEELSEKAQQNAVQEIREKLNGAWWDSGDDEEIQQEIVYAFARALGTPDVDKYGEADFAGIPRITLEGWDLERGQSVDYKGVLTRETAPKLPWTDDIGAVWLNTTPYGEREYGVYLEWADNDSQASQEEINAAADVMKEAVREAMHESWKAGRQQMDYLESDENAKDWIEGNEPEFTEDGKFWNARGNWTMIGT